MDFSNLLNFFTALDLHGALFVALGILGCGVLASLLIVLYTQKPKSATNFVRSVFFSRIFALACLFCLFDLCFVVTLYGLTPYTVFVGGILFLLFILSYIDCVLLAIPDFLNFLCLFCVFGGLHYLSLLSEWHFISAFCIAGVLSLIRIFGSFVFQKEILGEADIVVCASMGGVILLYPSVYLLLVSCVLAVAYILVLGLISFKDKTISLTNIKIPFVAFLTLGFVILLGYLEVGV